MPQHAGQSPPPTRQPATSAVPPASSAVGASQNIVSRIMRSISQWSAGPGLATEMTMSGPDGVTECRCGCATGHARTLQPYCWLPEFIACHQRALCHLQAIRTVPPEFVSATRQYSLTYPGEQRFPDVCIAPLWPWILVYAPVYSARVQGSFSRIIRMHAPKRRVRHAI